MIFKLNRNQFTILKEKVEETMEYIKDIQEDQEVVQFTINQEDIQEVQLLINDEIVSKGMDNQDTVNELGKELYQIYDEILYQKNDNK